MLGATAGRHLVQIVITNPGSISVKGGAVYTDDFFKENNNFQSVDKASNLQAPRKETIFDFHSMCFNLENYTEFNMPENSSIHKTYMNEYNDLCVLRFFENPDPIPFNENSSKEMRLFYRILLADSHAGIVETDFVEMANLKVVRVISKHPQEPTGITFTGSLSFYHQDKSYSINIQCIEQETTGMRETVVANELLIDDEDSWMQDPYDPTFNGTLLKSRADDIEWDEKFPEHPLSRLRASLRKIAFTFKFKHNE